MVLVFVSLGIQPMKKNDWLAKNANEMRTTCTCMQKFHNGSLAPGTHAPALGLYHIDYFNKIPLLHYYYEVPYNSYSPLDNIENILDFHSKTSKYP